MSKEGFDTPWTRVSAHRHLARPRELDQESAGAHMG